MRAGPVRRLPDGVPRADVIAAVVMTHGNAPRSWARSDGKGDAEAEADPAGPSARISRVRSAFTRDTECHTLWHVHGGTAHWAPACRVTAHTGFRPSAGS
ncbi:hypothetical protein SHKM778_52820 [Streptomyces sp. KM77-8]|uniref:Uncharacterized protein n=1 Tax=Streptomyces haneummycinicus TaxID=3074435 RepID=A0AAT9HMW2_9ACTN